MLHSVPAARAGFMESVREQLAWAGVVAPLSNRVIALAELLDHRGCLPDDQALIEEAGGDLLEEALAVLRSLEPRGIGARNAVETLLLQLADGDPDAPDIYTLLTEHLEALARNKLPDVARRMGRSVADVQALLERIRELDPQPLARFQHDAARRVRPTSASPGAMAAWRSSSTAATCRRSASTPTTSRWQSRRPSAARCAATFGPSSTPRVT